MTPPIARLLRGLAKSPGSDAPKGTLPGRRSPSPTDAHGRPSKDTEDRIRDEVSWLIKPTNNLVASPSFVFDFLACKVGTLKNYSKTITSTEFALVESKTGKGHFSSSQCKAMSKITLPLAIFHIKDVLEAPKSIKMGFELKSGQEWLNDLEPVDNEIYEFTSKAKIANQF